MDDHGILDVGCPINWDWPASRGLLSRWMAVPAPGWTRGLTLRDLVRGGKAANDGTLSNFAFPPTSTSGWSGPAGRKGGYGALNFDGADDVVTMASAAPPALFSISAWIRPRSLGEGNAGNVFAIRDTADGNPNYQVRMAGGSGTERIRMIAGWSGGLGGWDSPNGSIPLNAWTHVVITYDAGSASNDAVIYVNGVSVTVTEAVTPSGSINNTAHAWTVGNNTAGSGTFDGCLDDVCVWNVILSPALARAVYEDGCRGSPDSLRWLARPGWLAPEPASFDPAAFAWQPLCQPQCPLREVTCY